MHISTLGTTEICLDVFCIYGITDTYTFKNLMCLNYVFELYVCVRRVDCHFWLSRFDVVYGCKSVLAASWSLDAATAQQFVTGGARGTDTHNMDL